MPQHDGSTRWTFTPSPGPDQHTSLWLRRLPLPDHTHLEAVVTASRVSDPASRQLRSADPNEVADAATSWVWTVIRRFFPQPGWPETAPPIVVFNAVVEVAGADGLTAAMCTADTAARWVADKVAEATPLSPPPPPVRRRRRFAWLAGVGGGR